MFFKKHFLFFLIAICYFGLRDSYGQSFSPLDIANLRLWLSADTGLVLNGNKVTQWKDLSGQTNDATQSIMNAQPLLASQAMYSFSGVRFDDIDDAMTTNLNISSGDFTVIVLYNCYSAIPHAQRVVNGSNNFLIGPWGGNYDVFSGVFLGGKLIAPPSYVIQSVVIDSTPNAKNYINNLLYGQVSGHNYPGQIGLAAAGSNAESFDGNLMELIIYKNSLSDSLRNLVEQYLSNKYAPPVNLGADVTVNYGFCPVKLNAHKDWFTSYQWNTGSSTDSIFINNNGTFSINVTNIFGYTSSDSINVTFPGNFPPFFNDTIAICSGDTEIWNTQLDKTGYTFLWQDNSTDSVFAITQAGQYYVKVTDTLGCFFYSDTINVSIDNFPQTASLGPDTSVCSGASIGLVAGAAQATSYLWSTGATTSAIVVSSAGTYYVTVQNSNGCTAKDTINVTIKGIQPVVNFSSTTVCFPGVTQFTDLTFVISPDSAASWLWNFGDASVDSVKNPVHTYTVSGTYTTMLTVTTDSGCTSSAQFPVIVLAKPSANFTVASSPVCSGTSSQFLDASSVSNGFLSGWFWDFGDLSATNDTSDQKNPLYSYTAAGTYTVQLIVTTNSGCKDTIANTVIVSLSPAAFFTATSVCEGNNTSFTDGSTGAQQWQWNFGDATNSTLQNPAHQYLAAGTYNVILFVTASNGCVNFYMDTVAVYHLPQPQFTGDSVCVNGSLQFLDASSVIGSTINSWNWNFSNGFPSASSLQNPTVAYVSAGTNIVSLTATSAQGCSFTLANTVTVLQLPVADFNFAPTFGAPPLTIIFSDLTFGGTAYQWYFGDGGQSASQNPNHVYQDTGTFGILLISQSLFGCIDSTRDTILVDYPLLDIAVLDVFPVKSSNIIQVSVLLKNTGTLDVTNIELSAYFDNGTPIHEFWLDTAKPNKPPFAYQFNAILELVNEQHSIVCVEVKQVNGKSDDVIPNNKKCTAITDEFTLIDPFPNPVTNEIYFLFVLPDASKVQAQIWDARGRLVETLFDGDAAKGLNQITYNTFQLDKGIYVLKLSYKEQSITKMFMKE